MKIRSFKKIINTNEKLSNFIRFKLFYLLRAALLWIQDFTKSPFPGEAAGFLGLNWTPFLCPPGCGSPPSRWDGCRAPLQNHKVQVMHRRQIRMVTGRKAQQISPWPTGAGSGFNQWDVQGHCCGGTSDILQCPDKRTTTPILGV